MIGVWILIGVNSLMIITFLNADLERSVEADSKNQIHQNNKDYFNRQGHLALPFYYYPYFDTCYVSIVLKVDSELVIWFSL